MIDKETSTPIDIGLETAPINNELYLSMSNPRGNGFRKRVQMINAEKEKLSNALFSKYGFISSEEASQLSLTNYLMRLELKREIYAIRFSLGYRSKRMFHPHKIFRDDIIFRKYYFKDKTCMLRFCSEAITDVTPIESKTSKFKTFLKKHFTEVEIEALIKMVRTFKRGKE
jgi:hypothetical protein